jgi:hypothetical protein
LDKNIEKKYNYKRKQIKKGMRRKRVPTKTMSPHAPPPTNTHTKQIKTKQNKTKQIKTNSPASIPLSSSHTHGYF